jgi:hypothetical protein
MIFLYMVIPLITYLVSPVQNASKKKTDPRSFFFFSVPLGPELTSSYLWLTQLSLTVPLTITLHAVAVNVSLFPALHRFFISQHVLSLLEPSFAYLVLSSQGTSSRLSLNVSCHSHAPSPYQSSVRTFLPPRSLSSHYISRLLTPN